MVGSSTVFSFFTYLTAVSGTFQNIRYSRARTSLSKSLMCGLSNFILCNRSYGKSNKFIHVADRQNSA